MNSIENLNSTNFDSKRLSHAYIASGSTVEALAMATVCSGSEKRPCMECANCIKASRQVHPDITVVDRLPDRTGIIIEQIRALKKDIIGVASDTEKRAYIINGADRMNVPSQNAFLQILEEPPPHVVFILKTETPAKLLPTIRSRCIELRSRSDNDDTKTVSEGKSAASSEMAHDFIEALKDGNVGLSMFMLRLEKLERSQFTEFLMYARELVVAEAEAEAEALASGNSLSRDTLSRDTLSREMLTRDTLSQAYGLLEEAGGYLELNVNVGHIAGMICANLIKT